MARYTQQQVDALRDAVARGVRVVRYEDHEVTYHSLAEMRKLLTAMEQDVAGDSGKPNRRFAQVSKGINP